MTKLIYIANARLPTEKAHGIQIMKMCESLSGLEVGGRKLEVELVAPRRLNPIRQDPFEYYGVRRVFKITKLPTLDFISLGLGSFGFFAETIIFLTAARIYLLFKKYDILYTREPLAGLFFRNVVMELHSLPLSPPADMAGEARPPNFLLQKIWKNAKALLVLTSFIKNELIRHGVSADKVLVLPDAVDLEKFDIKISKDEARKKLGLPQDKKIVVYTGQLFDWKGAEMLVRAGEMLKSQNIEIYIVGGGGLPKATANLHFVGQKPHFQIPLWLKAADVLVLPNTGEQKISRYYTSPMKMFEYMASGRPIVASDLPSLREILTENDTLFFKAGDSHDLARAIKEVLANPPLADRLAQNALQKVQNYTWQNRARRAIDLITNIAG